MNHNQASSAHKKPSRSRKLQQAGPVRLSWKSKAAKSQCEEAIAKSNSTKPKAMPHRYKTEMCKKYMEGQTCPFGDKCNFAHGERQLQKFKALAEASLAESLKKNAEETVKEDQENFSVAMNSLDGSFTFAPSSEKSETTTGKPSWIMNLIESGPSIDPAHQEVIAKNAMVSEVTEQRVCAEHGHEERGYSSDGGQKFFSAMPSILEDAANESDSTECCKGSEYHR